MNENEVPVRDVLTILKRRWKFIVIVTLIVTILATIVCYFFITPKYKSTTKVFIGKQNNYSQEYNVNNVQLYKELVDTYKDLIMTDDLVESALVKNNIDLESQEVIDGINTTSNKDSQVFEISYESTNPELTKKVLDAVTEEFIDKSNELIPNVNIAVIGDAKLPINPISPNKKSFIVFGAALGFILSILIIFINDSFKSNSEDSDTKSRRSHSM